MCCQIGCVQGLCCKENMVKRNESRAFSSTFLKKWNSDSVVKAGYIVAYLIATKSFTDGEFVNPCIEIISDIICPGGGRIVLKSACLLDYSRVNRRNWKMERNLRAVRIEAHTVECLPGTGGSWVQAPALCEVEAGALEVQGHRSSFVMPTLRLAWAAWSSASKGRKEGKMVDLSRVLPSLGCGHSHWCLPLHLHSPFFLVVLVTSITAERKKCLLLCVCVF